MTPRQTRTITQAEYEAAGGFYRLPVPSGCERIFIAVLARHHSPGGRAIFSSSNDPKCRCGPVYCTAPMELAYEIRKGLWPGPKRTLAITVRQARTGFAGVVLVADAHQSVSREAGETLLQWTLPLLPGQPFSGQQEIDFSCLREKRWRRCHVRLFAADPAQEGWCHFRHPTAKAIEL